MLRDLDLNLPRAVLATLAALAIPALSQATVWTVNCDPATFPDFTSIGAALAGGVANGDTVVVETCNIAPFAYNETVDLSGLSGVRLVAADAGYFGARQEGVAVGVPAPPVVIDGNGLAGPCVLVAGSADVAVHAFRIVRCTTDGVEISSSVRTLVEGNFIRPNGGDPVADFAGTGTRVTGNQVRGTIQMTDSRQCMVIDNFATTDAPPIVIDGGEGCSVDNNYALSTGPTAIDVVAGTEHRIERNTAIGNVNAIVVGPGATDADVIGNDINTAIADAGAGTDVANNF